MTKGFLTTLFAAAVSFAGTTAAFAAAPVISGIPDVQIGDLEDNGASDNNFFVFTNAFQFSSKVTDADTAAGSLLWSFGEYFDVGAPYADGPTNKEFEINGKQAIAVGAAAVAAEQGSNFAGAKAVTAPNSLNATSDYASFRDILFSPTTDAPPFNNGIGLLTPTQKNYSATVGKNVVFYVADPQGNVDDAVIKVKTKDQDNDKVSATFDVLMDEGKANPFVGWVENGLNSTAADGAEDVDRTDNTGAVNPATPTVTQTDLGTIVRASSGRYRVLGWTNKTGVPYPGASKYLRGKFYVYTNNGAADATNKYPNFRARLQHGGAYVGVTNFQYAATGNTGGAAGNFPYSLTDVPLNETNAGQYLKPSRTAAKPSLYRVDFDPVDVSAAGARPIIPTFETFAYNDPAAANIFLTQCVIGTFPALTDAAGTAILTYNNLTTLALQGIKADFTGLNAEGDVTPGYKQGVFLGSGGTFATQNVTSGAGSTGLLVDTGATNPSYTNQFIIGAQDVIATNNNARGRLVPGKYYRGRFYATSDVPTTAAAFGTQRQGNLRFRLQTASNVVNCYQDFVGDIRSDALTPAGATGVNGYRDGVIGGQAMPGSNSANPDNVAAAGIKPTGSFNGGWYTVLLPNPLDGDIRRDVNPAGTVDAATFGNLFNAPGPGDPALSAKDIRAGMDVYSNPTNLKVSNSIGVVNNFFDANRARVALTAVTVYEYNASSVTDDGGYGY